MLAVPRAGLLCLMSNHVHLVVVPERADSLAVLFRRVHGAYAQAVNASLGRSGHLWQNRFYSCPLSERHLWIALRYVEANPVRAGVAPRPELYRWSSAAVHLGEREPERSGALDIAFWLRSGGAETWREMHTSTDGESHLNLLRRCTYAGRPFGDEEFLHPAGGSLSTVLVALELRKSRSGRSTNVAKGRSCLSN